MYFQVRSKFVAVFDVVYFHVDMELGFAQVNAVSFRCRKIVRHVFAHVLRIVPNFKIVDAVLRGSDLERSATIVVLGEIKAAGIPWAYHFNRGVLGSLVFVNEVTVLAFLSEVVRFSAELGSDFAWSSCAVYAIRSRVVATVVIVFGIAVLFGEPAGDENLWRYIVVKGDNFVLVDKVAGYGWHFPACFIK